MADFVSTMQAITGGLKVLKELNQVDREYDKAAQKLKIAELTTALAAAQITLAEAQAELIDNAKLIAALRRNFDMKAEDMVEVRGFHYRKGPKGEAIGPPYCPRCLTEGKAHLVVRTSDDRRAHNCPECKRDYRATVFLYPDQRGD